MLFHTERKSVTLSGGAYSANTERFSGALLQQVLVVPTDSNNQYDFTITNPAGDVIFRRLSVTGRMDEIDVGLPLIGANTYAIANANVPADPVVILLVCRNV